MRIGLKRAKPPKTIEKTNDKVIANPWKLR